ncbi:MAG: ligase-associated DNA damage response endonuclease PdeM, partial [Beijerinckiaceae bacterium]
MSAALVRANAGAPFAVGALECIPDARGGLYLPQHRSLLVADLHLEKGSSFARRGMLAPPYDTRATLTILGAMIMDFQPQRIIALGDNFHDDDGADRLGAEDFSALADLQKGRDWLWIAGNHDPSPPVGVGGDVAPFLHLDGVLLWHAASARDPRPQIAGHLHPCAR